MLHGKKDERVEIRLDSFDKTFVTAISNMEGNSVGKFFRNLLNDYKKEFRNKLTDAEYKQFLDYMLVLTQTKR